MPLEKIRFPGSRGAALAARLDRPAGPVRAYALFAHCFTCTKDIFAAGRIARGLTEHGIAVLRFDFTGLGHSEGEFANTDFSSNVDDLKAAAAHMRETLGAPSILIGHSLGGAAVLAAAGDLPEVKAVATIGAPFDPGHVGHLFDDHRAAIERDGEAEVTLVGRPFRIRKEFLDDIAEQNQAPRIANLKKALLIFHAPRDAIVGIDNAGLIFQAAKHPKSFCSLDDADHLLSRRADADYVADVLAAWADRYIDPAAAPAADDLPAGTVQVAETGNGRFQQTVRMGPHRLTADEPESVGGTDTGGTPYDLLLAGLGACTSMTLRLYAERKKLPVDRVTVTLSHDRIHAEDCAACETTDGRIDRIRVGLAIEGDLDADQRARLMEISQKCPVHRTLTTETVIETDWAEMPGEVE
jgi:putative redox protein